ncbi:DUF59 domain-containing protein [Mycetocola tolaasinivorans]|uniref:Iron-sulfur cluster carrier protein n=1 Tax=Mycetocola tolaasinivorans TaxID=76635 RepID=A0A3L7A943_9MICO|nr:DUF59 domain-containing protein [Mycetocola tolaasinivorans]
MWRALGTVQDPEIRRPITELDMVESARVDDAGVAHVGILLTIVGCPAANAIEAAVRAAASGVEGVGAVELTVGVMTPAQRQALTERLRGDRGTREMPFGPGTLTRVFAVTSGKGGVGKSTITANLAAAFAARGLRVGIVDADVHGFSIPGLLGVGENAPEAVRPTRLDNMILPPVAHGIKLISIGMFLDDPRAAVAWRGPMLHRTINQFLTDVYFGDLDVLLLDLPPGTGDIAISIGQLLPNAEVVVVTTPQPAAAEVAERSGTLAVQTGQRIAGVIENMAGLVQPDGSVLDLFGSGGGALVAERLSTIAKRPVPVLASVPLSVELRTGGDAGVPVVIADPESSASRAILSAADALLAGGRSLAGVKLGLSPR